MRISKSLGIRVEALVVGGRSVGLLCLNNLFEGWLHGGVTDEAMLIEVEGFAERGQSGLLQDHP